LFFTQNGEFIGVAFAFSEYSTAELRDDQGRLVLYPTVALGDSEPSVTFNFGQNKFMFDLDAYMLQYKVPSFDPTQHVDFTHLWPLRFGRGQESLSI